ncbi:MAG: IclR family transcriptional regulator [Acidobacteria bacterium]|nr:IclR family transcriptional regulator [Acidobacteriota bacterium]
MLRTRSRSPGRSSRSAKPHAGKGAPELLEKPKYLSKAIAKALDTLDAVRSSPEPVSLHELTAQMGIAKSSLFRILYTLEAASYLERDGQGRYRMPPAFRSAAPSHSHTLVRLALPHMRELNRECRETVSLAMRFDNHIEVVATIESPQLIRMGNTVGRILPPHASSLGKAITAFQPEEMREALIRSYGLHCFTDQTVVDELELRRELEIVRTRGFSTDVEESALEGCCFGAPIRGAGNRVTSAISLSMPKMRLQDEEHRKRLIDMIVRAAQGVSGDLLKPAAADGIRQHLRAATLA